MTPEGRYDYEHLSTEDRESIDALAKANATVYADVILPSGMRISAGTAHELMAESQVNRVTAPMSSAMAYDGSTITVDRLVRHRNGDDVWRVESITADESGRAYLSLVNPDDPNHRTAFYADCSVMAEAGSGVKGL